MLSESARHEIPRVVVSVINGGEAALVFLQIVHSPLHIVLLLKERRYGRTLIAPEVSVCARIPTIVKARQRTEHLDESIAGVVEREKLSATFGEWIDNLMITFPCQSKRVALLDLDIRFGHGD